MATLDPLAALALPKAATILPGQPRTLAVTVGHAYQFNITIPVGVLEWFVSAYEHQREAPVWEDWMDYTGYQPGPDDLAELAADMTEDIQQFIVTLSKAENFRIVQERKTLFGPLLQPQLYLEGEWRPLHLSVQA